MERKSEIRWHDDNGRKAAHTNTHSFKPQKLFRATNSFYKAGCALIPVISKTEGRRMARKALASDNEPMLQISLLPDVFLYILTSMHILGWHQSTCKLIVEMHRNTTHLSWRRWVLPAARWGWLGSLHPPQPEEELSAAGQSGCVGGWVLPRCGCQPQGELLNIDKQEQIVLICLLWQ